MLAEREATRETTPHPLACFIREHHPQLPGSFFYVAQTLVPLAPTGIAPMVGTLDIFDVRPINVFAETTMA
jgi:hypothetical protein